MRFLAIVQDLKVYGTSEGIVSRSFLAKLRQAYPYSVINVLYLKDCDSNDELNLLPVDTIKEIKINKSTPRYITVLNWAYWRLFNNSLKEKLILKKYRSEIKKTEFEEYDHIFVRSAGQGFETILATEGLPILEKSIINFHDPYPVFWDTGSLKELTNLELYKLRKMYRVVEQAKACISPSLYLSRDMEYLYGLDKKFFTLPHQFDEKVCQIADGDTVRKKRKKVVLSYHGAVMLTRNLDILLDAYAELLNNNVEINKNSELLLRIKGPQVFRLKQKYKHISNIVFLKSTLFQHAAYEQQFETDFNIVLENSGNYSNILVGKAPFLAFLGKPLLSLSPKRSEMRRILKKENYIANSGNQKEIKQKLSSLILKTLQDGIPNNEDIFENYFSQDKFKNKLQKILESR